MWLPMVRSGLKKIYNAVYIGLFGSISYARRLGVQIGCDCRIYIISWGSEPFLIKIGDRVTVSSSVKFLTHDGATWLVRNSAGQRFQKYAPIIIGDDVFIGAGAILLPGVTVGSRVVIGAGSIVTKNISDNSVVAGSPARLLSTFDAFKKKIEDRECNERDLPTGLNYRQRVEYYLELSGRR